MSYNIRVQNTFLVAYTFLDVIADEDGDPLAPPPLTRAKTLPSKPHRHEDDYVAEDEGLQTDSSGETTDTVEALSGDAPMPAPVEAMQHNIRVVATVDGWRMATDVTADGNGDPLAPPLLTRAKTVPSQPHRYEGDDDAGDEGLQTATDTMAQPMMYQTMMYQVPMGDAPMPGGYQQPAAAAAPVAESSPGSGSSPGASPNARPAPPLDAPMSHDVPMAQPGQTPGAGIKALSATELQSTGVLARPATASGCTHVHWAVSASKLKSDDQQAVSPVFVADLPGHGPTPFKLLAHAKASNDLKRGAGFKKAKGKGRVVLKCETQLQDSLADISFRIGVGRAGQGSKTLQEFRGPETGNFFHYSNHGLSKCDEEWDFAASVDDSRMFVVTVEIAPAAALTNNPSIWWEDVEV